MRATRQHECNDQQEPASRQQQGRRAWRHKNGSERLCGSTLVRRLQPALRLYKTLDLPTFAASQSSFPSSLSATSGSSSLAVVMLGERPGFGTAAR